MSDDTKAENQALCFYDFADVNRPRLLKAIMDHDRSFETPARRKTVSQQLRHHRGRFSQGGSRWDWDSRDLVARGVAIGKLAEKQGDDRAHHERILSFLQELHPYVHAGWRAMNAVLDPGNRRGVLVPRMRSRTAREYEIGPTLLASTILTDLMLCSQEALEVRGYEKRLKRLAHRNLDLGR